MRTALSTKKSAPASEFRIPPAFVLGFGALVVAAASLALGQPLYVAGAIYAIAFLAIAWTRPDAALLLIFISAPFQTDLGGQNAVKFSVAEVDLLLSLVVLLLQNVVQRRRLSLGPIALPVCLYFSVCALSSALHWQGLSAVTSLGQMFLYFVVTVVLFSQFARRLEDLRRALLAFVLIGVLLALVGPATSFNFLGMNKNGIGASLSCAVLVCLELWIVAKTKPAKAWLGLALALIAGGLLLSLSRGAWLGALCGMVAITLLRRQFTLLVRVLAILVPVIALCWFILPKEQKSYATDFGSGRFNIQARYKSVDFANKFFQQSPVMGVGVGLRKQYDATNLVMSTLAETGVVGLVTFSLIYVSLFWMIWQAQKRVSRSDLRFSFLTIGAALTLCTLAHGMVDHYWSRGAITLAWASTGMATGVYLTLQRSKPLLPTSGISLGGDTAFGGGTA